MGNEYALDAHALVWFVGGNTRLGPNARAAMQDPANVLYLPVIALAEACWAVERGKTSIPSVGALLGAVDADPRFIIVPLDRAIFERSLTLSAISEMHDRSRAISMCVHRLSPGPLTFTSRYNAFVAPGGLP